MDHRIASKVRRSTCWFHSAAVTFEASKKGEKIMNGSRVRPENGPQSSEVPSTLGLWASGPKGLKAPDFGVPKTLRAMDIQGAPCFFTLYLVTFTSSCQQKKARAGLPEVFFLRVERDEKKGPALKGRLGKTKLTREFIWTQGNREMVDMEPGSPTVLQCKNACKTWTQSGTRPPSNCPNP